MTVRTGEAFSCRPDPDSHQDFSWMPHFSSHHVVVGENSVELYIVLRYYSVILDPYYTLVGPFLHVHIIGLHVSSLVILLACLLIYFLVVFACLGLGP